MTDSNTRRCIIFDIETGPVSDRELVRFMPNFQAPSNYKDEEKIKAAITQKQLDWMGDAALSPITGRVEAIGYCYPGPGRKVVSKIELANPTEESERALISEFWSLFTTQSGWSFAGFNIKGFDLPFLLRRSWKLGVIPPGDARENRYWNNRFIDLMELWQLGNRQEYISLDKVSRFLGGTGKTGDGSMFYKMEPEQKRTYLEQDLKLTSEVASRMLTGVATYQPEQGQ